MAKTQAQGKGIALDVCSEVGRMVELHLLDKPKQAQLERRKQDRKAQHSVPE